MSDAYVTVRTTVTDPLCRKIMEELNGKVSPILNKPYKVVFEGDHGKDS